MQLLHGAIVVIVSLHRLKESYRLLSDISDTHLQFIIENPALGLPANKREQLKLDTWLIVAGGSRSWSAGMTVKSDEELTNKKILSCMQISF